MKKRLLALLLTVGVLGCASAADSGWEFLQIAFAPGMPSDVLTVPVNGVRVGAPISDGAPVNGVEASVLFAGTAEVNGFKGSLVATDGKKVAGLQLGIVNFVKDCAGLQLGIYNEATDSAFQLGILNHIENGWLPWFPVINFNF